MKKLLLWFLLLPCAWQPNIQTDAEGKATVSFPMGAVGNTRIIVQVVGSQGIPLAASAINSVNL